MLGKEEKYFMDKECRMLGQGWRNVCFLVLYGLSLRNIERSVGLLGLDIITNGI